MQNTAKRGVGLVLRSLFLVMVFMTLAMAAQITVVVGGNADMLFVQAEQPMRFYVDYNNRAVVVPDAVVKAGEDQGVLVRFGASLEQRSDGIVLKTEQAFTVSLSPDGKRITLLKTSSPTASSTSVVDDRVPTMYYLSNANPTQVAAMLQDLYPGLRVRVDERQRAVVVLINANDRPVIEALIKKLDAPRPQVAFEAEILEINRSMSQSLGIDYEKLINLNIKFGESNVPTGQLGFGTFTRQGLSLEAGIRLLKSNGVARTLARPRVVTLDGLEARINATRTRPVKTIQNGNVSLINITTGISLSLLPRISPDNVIESRINIAVSSPTEAIDNVPGYATREASTTVRVRNGEPIVIGGLLESRTSQGESGIPGLMDIPVVGFLFKVTTSEEAETDLLITVTPSVVDFPTNPASVGGNSATPPVPGAPQQP